MQKNAAPIIITLQLNPEAATFFNEQRVKYFPAHCNYMEAHLTLFNRVNGNVEMVQQLLEKSTTAGFIHLKVSALINMGKGIAYTIDSPELLLLQKEIKQQLKPYLGLKDKKKYWPHITIQNKVTAFKAQQTHQQLLENFTPFTAQAIGFSTWYFNKNKWAHIKDIGFHEK